MSKTRIITQPQLRDGQLFVGGTDVTVEYLLDNLAAGRSQEQLLAKHPDLKPDAIEAAKAFAVKPRYEYSNLGVCLRIRHIIAGLRPHPIVDIICEAFEDVRLGRGPSLHQLYVMDNYGNNESGRPLSRQQYVELAHQDETHNWRAIELTDLEEYSSLAFADGEAFRFYLPAHLIESLTAPYGDQDIVWWLTLDRGNEYLRNYDLQRYEFLDDSQKHAVATYLWYLLDVPYPHYPRAPREVEAALEGYWFQFL